MKSKHKHELQTNVLADTLGQLYVKAQPHATSIGYVALGGLIVVLAVILLVLPALTGGSKGSVASDAFAKARAASTPEAMKAFLAEFATAPESPAARLLLADRLLNEAVRAASPTSAAASLAEARKEYEQVLPISASLAPLAKVGLAMVTIQEGDMEKGRAALQEIVKANPQSVAAAKAQANLAMLADYKVVQFSAEPPDESPAMGANPFSVRPVEAPKATPTAEEAPKATPTAEEAPKATPTAAEAPVPAATKS
jgi:hypothetical protein